MLYLSWLNTLNPCGILGMKIKYKMENDTGRAPTIVSIRTETIKTGVSKPAAPYAHFL